MKSQNIEVGKTYFSGSGGRFETRCRVLEMGLTVHHLDGKNTVLETGVRFVQVKGPYTGKEGTITLKSFAQWAKGEVATGKE
ncbi:hypothetical protein [Paenibacillus rigui]|uniref:hypothetical protein n=1 Tax=Paenibacillus rigui TaxID=554312 RepID=UPI000B8B240E|nr:hypothetical protein [Paenibacillus rigui]